MLEMITLEPQTSAQYTVIWLHGLGADGNDFVPLVSELGLPRDHAIRFIFPHAPMRPVTLNNGYVMRAWFDIIGLNAEDRIDRPSLYEAMRDISEIIEQQHQAGIAYDHIILAGFSQGGATVLQVGLSYPKRLGGIMALSAFLTLPDEINKTALLHDIPLLLAHGRFDNVVRYDWGKSTYALLQSLGYQPEWHEYPVDHTVCLEEVKDISRWLKNIIK